MSRIVDFEIPSSDGYPLRGNCHLPDGEPAPGVLIVHGFKGFKDWGMFPLIAERLAEAGLAACRFNLSGSGIGPDGETYSDKDRFENATYTRDLEDIELMLGKLAAGEIPGAPTRVGKVGLLGHSRGGGAALLAADRAEQVASLTTWSAISTVDRFAEEVLLRWKDKGTMPVENARTGDVFNLKFSVAEDTMEHLDELDILAATGRLRIPTLLIHGKEDETVPLAEGEKLLGMLGGRGKLFAVGGAGHTFGGAHPMPAEFPAPLAEVFDATAAHFVDTLR